MQLDDNNVAEKDSGNIVDAVPKHSIVLIFVVACSLAHK